VLDSLVDLTTFHVTDLNTIDRIVTPSSLIIPGHLSTALVRIQKLTITLRLPLQAYEGHEISLVQNAAANTSSWLKLCPAIARLERLRRLELWIDHDDPSSWSVVNERAFLSPLDNLVSHPGLDISVNLPKLHPLYETPDRHFTHKSAQPSYNITRRLRQCYHAVQGADGNFHKEEKQDFPILWDDDSDEELEEVEQKEREMWENGVDVEAVVRTNRRQSRLAARVVAAFTHLHPRPKPVHEANETCRNVRDG